MINSQGGGGGGGPGVGEGEGERGEACLVTTERSKQEVKASERVMTSNAPSLARPRPPGSAHFLHFLF